LQNSSRLKSEIHRINNKGYKAYLDLKGEYDFVSYQLYIDHVQGDPFASPSSLRVRVEQDLARFPQPLFQTKPRKIAICDYLACTYGRSIPEQPLPLPGGTDRTIRQ
jgi:predicted ABC-class ATPase